MIELPFFIVKLLENLIYLREKQFGFRGMCYFFVIVRDVAIAILRISSVKERICRDVGALKEATLSVYLFKVSRAFHTLVDFSRMCCRYIQPCRSRLQSLFILNFFGNSYCHMNVLTISQTLQHNLMVVKVCL